MNRFLKTFLSLSVFLLAAGGIFSSAGKTDSPEAISSINELPMVDYGQEKLKEKLRFSDLLSSEVKTIVLDAGHGGKDRGCKGNHHTKEKEIALAITLKLGSYIESYFPDIKVIYTRKEDVFVTLNRRARIANESKADLFISIHCNYIRNRPDVFGSETYVMGLHTADHNLNVALRENAAITLEDDFGKDYEGYDPNSVESHILLSMYQNAYLERSILFAELCEQQMAKASEGKHHSRGVRQAGFLVLKETAMPSVLVESGYLSHDQDEAYLRSDVGQRQVAYGIFNALSIYKNVIEKKDAEIIPVAQNVVSKIQESTEEDTSEKTETVEKVEPSKNANHEAVQKENLPTDEGSKETVEKKVSRSATEKEETPKTTNKEKPLSTTALKDQIYKVQLVATPRAVDMKQPRFARIANEIQILKVDGLMRYLVHAGSTEAEAQEKLKELKANGFPKAFLSLYEGEERLQIIY